MAEALPGPRAARGAAGFDRDTQHFLLTLEMSAKTILKVSPLAQPPKGTRLSSEGPFAHRTPALTRAIP